MTLQRGTDNVRSKLSEEEVVEIFLDQELNQSELARKYNISQSTVNHIKKKRTWSWLTDKEIAY